MMANLIRLVRFVLILMIAILVWRPVVALVSGDITADQAISAIFTDGPIKLAVGVIILTLVASIFDTGFMRTVVCLAVCLLGFLIINGTISVASIQDHVKSYDISNKVKQATTDCGLQVTPEDMTNTEDSAVACINELIGTTP